MDKYNATLANSLDTIAPYKIKKLPTKIFSPWFNDTTRMHKRMCRKLERRWEIDWTSDILSKLER